MKKFLLVATLAFLASCGANNTTTNTTTTTTSGTTTQSSGTTTTTTISGTTVTTSESGAVTVLYPSSLTETPAAKYCQSKSGTATVEKQNNMDVLYCTVNGKKVDAWKFMSENAQ